MPEVISDRAGARLRQVTSRQNSMVKELRQAFAQGQAVDGMCAVEGLRLIEEAIRSRLKVHALFIRESSKAKAERILDQLSKRTEALMLPDSVFDSAVLTEHPQGIAALVKIQEHDLDSALRVAPALLVVAAGIQDPGNFGTLVRSAEAFGANAVAGTEGTVNHWNPKTLRASAGSMFRLPVLKLAAEELIQQLRARDIRVLGLVAPHSNGESAHGDGKSARSPLRLQDTDLTRSCALLVGNEGAGVPRELMRKVDEFVAIPQARVESLNAGIAASIALYEAQRQRSALV
ncbi:MAG TPA: RNA methyltransferase [Terriglobales bacterium]|nr:RNA methyltransferase [Terriglobales bacterium]